MNERLVYPDLARGIAILFVVEWHTINVHFLWADEWIMPVFFFITGMFFRQSADRKSLMIKKTKTLLIPALLWTLPMLFIKGIETSFKDVLMLLINPFKCVYGVTWFLWATFFCYLIYNEISLRIKNEVSKLFIVIFLSTTGFYMSNIEIQGHRLQLPLYMSTSLTCLLYLYAGEYLKNRISITPPHTLSTYLGYTIRLLIFSLISIGGIFLGFQNSSLIENYYGKQLAIVYYVTSISGILCFMSCCVFISNHLYLKKLCYIGEHSLLVLLIHPYIKLILKSWFDVDGFILFIFCVLFTITIVILVSKYFPILEGKI